MIDTNEIRADELCFHPKSRETILALCDEIDRLQKQNVLRECLSQSELANASLRPAAKPKPQGKMVRVKVAVAVDKTGYWRAEGRKTEEDILYTNVRDYMHSEHRVYWLTADLPIPEETEIVAEVENA